MKKIFVATLIMLTSMMALASMEGGMAKTTDMYAPKAGGSELVPTLTLWTGKDDGNSTSTAYSGSIFGLEFGHGFSDVFAVYARQEYYNTQLDFSPGSSTSKKTGIGDTKVGIKAVIDFGASFFYYDVGYQTALLAKSTFNAATNETSGVNGRPSLQAQAGLGAAFNMLGLGGLYKQYLYQDGETTNSFAGASSTTKNKAANGSEWKLYAQLQSHFKLGIAYGESVNDSYDQVTLGLTSTAAKSEYKNIFVYSIIPIAASSELFLEIQKQEPKTAATGTTYGHYFVTAAYRMMF